MCKSIEKEIKKVRSELKSLKEEIWADDCKYCGLSPDHYREAFMNFAHVLESKIESEGEFFLMVDGGFQDIFHELDVEDIKQTYPLNTEEEYYIYIGLRIFLLQQCKNIEIHYKLMEFFVENEYGKDSPGIRLEWLKRDKAELDKILCGIVTYPGDSCICREHRMDPHLRSALYRYVQLFMVNSHKVKSKEAMLNLVKDDRNESLSAAKEEYMGAILSDSLRCAHPYGQLFYDWERKLYL
ncbi:hypothetical protein QJS04_geneDACA024101 [Acorus gramineus]|uniref:Uncharacterized protein n=1 Tax=Acorus gramineus TaxID=55184 RepID=A0AAV9AP51_ACOGR|nr:hypothetical protein QJS04_geneDACA024101 [Acorus gramineus]